MSVRKQSQSWISRTQPHTAAITLVTVFLFLVTSTRPGQAQTFTVLHTFTGAGDGHAPYTGLTFDRAGNLYGTTTDAYGPGTVFQMKRRNGSWVLNTLHTFSSSDGYLPHGGVTFGPDGSLYGTTSTGGGSSCGGEDVCGSVYNLRPPSRACASTLCPWVFTKLYEFQGGNDAADPGHVKPIFDVAGNLYGTTVEGGGLMNDGTVFELIPSGSGWTESLLQTNMGNPNSGLIMDRAGNLYGTSTSGGTVFELSLSGSGWTLQTLFRFPADGSDGTNPWGALIMDGAGNLYGTTNSDGPGGGGTVFEMSPSGGGWTFSLLYSLAGRRNGGPYESLAMDAAGNLYGTTVKGGPNECGNVFRLSPTPNGWAYTDLHDFTCRADGQAPYGGPIVDASGNIYGTAAYGGMFGGDCNGPNGIGCGTVWKITP